MTSSGSSLSLSHHLFFVQADVVQIKFHVVLGTETLTYLWRHWLCNFWCLHCYDNSGNCLWPLVRLTDDTVRLGIYLLVVVVLSSKHSGLSFKRWAIYLFLCCLCFYNIHNIEISCFMCQRSTHRWTFQWE